MASLRIIFLVMLATLSSCSQHHALKSPANPSQKFFGTVDETGENIVHEFPAMPYDDSDLNCQQSQTRYAPSHYRVDKVIHDMNMPVGQLSSKQSVFSAELTLSPGDLLSYI